MKLEFGRPVAVGNYTVTKINRTLSRRQVKELRMQSNVPDEAAKWLERARLPYIKVSTSSGSWSVEFVIGTTMYNAIDSVNVVMDADGNRMVYGTEGRNMEAMFVAMLADTTTVGDFEYQIAKQKLLQEYLDRASKARNANEDEGKSEEQVAKENEEAAQEVLDSSEHKTMVLDMAGRIVNGEGKDGSK